MTKFYDAVEFADKMFPSDAPHHIVIMSNREYKEYNKSKSTNNYLRGVEDAKKNV